MATTMFRHELDPLLGRSLALNAESGDIYQFADSTAQRSLVVLDPQDALALWSPLRTHVLRLRLGPESTSTDIAEAVHGLIHGLPHAGVDDGEEAASVTVPSRDPRIAAALMANHFSPVTHLAVRSTARQRQPPALPRYEDRRFRIRPATAADVPALVEMAVDLQVFDTQFGVGGIRPDAASPLASELRVMRDAEPDLTWVLDAGDEVAGFAQVQTAEQAPWAVESYVEPAQAGYLASMFVTPPARGLGGAAMLDEAAYQLTLERGWSALLLHHAVANPWSAPFWARQGYRPLMTTWMRRPLHI